MIDLEKELELLRKRDWIKFTKYGKGGGLCALGVMDSLHSAEKDVVQIKELANTVKELFPDRYNKARYDSDSPMWEYWKNRRTIHSFNDHKDTTKADVEQVFEKANIRLQEII